MVGSQQNKDSYFNRLHLVGIATLTVIVVGLALFGWSLRPPSGGYPALPDNMVAALTPSVPDSANPSLVESLTHVSGGSTVVLRSMRVDGAFPVASGWSVYFYNLDPGYRLCSPPAAPSLYAGVEAQRLPAQHLSHPKIASTSPGFVNPVEVAGSGPMYIELCWNSGGPVQANGAYLSARFFPIQGNTLEPVGLTRQLNVGSGTTADYSVQSVVLPTADYNTGWLWSQHPPSNVSLGVSAVNTTQTQHDNYQAFLSGIVFGVAGGAFVALIQEFVAPFRTRKELRPPEPGG